MTVAVVMDLDEPTTPFDCTTQVEFARLFGTGPSPYTDAFYSGFNTPDQNRKEPGLVLLFELHSALGLD